jgi:hypothetical protein
MFRVLFPEGVNDITDKAKVGQCADKSLFSNERTDFAPATEGLL